MCQMSGVHLQVPSTTSQQAPSCIPFDTISQAAYHRARSKLHPVILNHSIRVFLYATAISEREHLPWHNVEHIPLLFTAAMFHDMGTVDSCDGPQRFEVEGADAAVTFLKFYGVPEQRAHQVWVAIACHTCAGIGERISSLARLIRLGPLIDFKQPDILDPNFIAQAEREFPRGDPAKVLSDLVVEQALRQPTKAPAATWPGGLTRFRKENPDWEGLNKEF